MKITGWLLAAVLAGTGLAATPAAAKSDHVRVVERTRVTYSDDRRWDGRSDRGHHYGRSKWRWRTDCRTQWRNGHRERVCRKVRYRR